MTEKNIDIIQLEMGGEIVVATARGGDFPEKFASSAPLIDCSATNGGFALDVEFADDVPGGAFTAVSPRAGAVEFRMKGVRCALDLNAERGALKIVTDESAVEYALKLIFGALLGRRGGGIIHAAALERNGAGRIFCGPPGAGKSTAAEIGARGGAAAVLNDELAVVVADEQGARVCPMPAWAAAGTRRDDAPGGARGCRLAYFYALSHAAPGEATAFRILRGADAARALFENMRFVLPAAEAIGAAMDAADALRRAAPVAEMAFSLADAPRFWEVVDGFEHGEQKI